MYVTREHYTIPQHFSFVLIKNISTAKPTIGTKPALLNPENKYNKFHGTWTGLRKLTERAERNW